MEGRWICGGRWRGSMRGKMSGYEKGEWWLMRWMDGTVWDVRVVGVGWRVGDRVAS